MLRLNAKHRKIRLKKLDVFSKSLGENLKNGDKSVSRRNMNIHYKGGLHEMTLI